LFAELERADPARGAKPVVRAHAAEMIEVPIDDEGAFTDIDTPEEYERWIGSLAKGSWGSKGA
jgi:CTP:molybdopterin cytidylyltransferase MocA